MLIFEIFLDSLWELELFLRWDVIQSTWIEFVQYCIQIVFTHTLTRTTKIQQYIYTTITHSANHCYH